ncbi:MULTISPECIES: recombinase family protein [Sporomusa]|jgi:site-specific DNA recombinase|uniref:recombinase family protein n=1 Tax=Sporomusa TaxID=2375 RepID=UPI0031594DBC
MKVAIYARVSTDQQAEKGYSIETQLEACRKYADELCAVTVEEFVDDGYSAEFIERPALTRLRAAVKAKQFAAVIFYDPDRMARNLLHQLIIAEEIDKSGAELKFVVVNYDQSADGKFMFGIRGLLAELEKEKIKERTMRGKRGKAAKGLVISDTKPFGYTFDPQKSTYVINKTEAEIVCLIFDFMVKEKMGTAKICKELNARGIPSPRTKNAWIVSSIHRILTNTLYKGVLYSMKYRYEKIGLKQKRRTLRPESEWIPVFVPAIIDEMTWQAAQQQLRENKNLAKRNLKHNYLLQGLVSCAKCGRAMVISRSGGKGHSYYACISRKSTSYACSGRKPCIARQIPTEVLDTYVFKYLLEHYYNPVKIGEYIQEFAGHKDLQKYEMALEQLTKAEKELTKQKTAVLRWFRQKILSEAEVETQLQDIRQQLSSILHLKKSYETELAAIPQTPSPNEVIEKIDLKVHETEFTITEKKAALQAIIDSIIVERIDNTRGRGSRPEINVMLKLK